MKKGLQGWEVTEGRTSFMGDTRDPKVSEIIAALEAIRSNIEHPFIALTAPGADEDQRTYCQALACEDGYACEIRIYKGDEFRHMRALSPDPEGRIGKRPDMPPNWTDGDDPNLGQVCVIFTTFIADPDSFPKVDGLEWWDMTADFETAD